MASVVAMLAEAVEQGHDEAPSLLAEIYNGGLGVPINHTKSHKYYTVAARGGNALCMMVLGNHYRDGRGCEQSHERAAEWWTKAVAEGYAPARGELAMAYRTGTGVPVDLVRSFELFKEGASGADPMTQANLATCYLQVSSGRVGVFGREAVLSGAQPHGPIRSEQRL